jgi:hypothetical protein
MVLWYVYGWLRLKSKPSKKAKVSTQIMEAIHSFENVHKPRLQCKITENFVLSHHCENLKDCLLYTVNGQLTWIIKFIINFVGNAVLGVSSGDSGALLSDELRSIWIELVASWLIYCPGIFLAKSRKQ